MTGESRDVHRIARSIRKLAIGASEARRRIRNRNDLTRGHLRVERFQVPVTGSLGLTGAFDRRTIEFDVAYTQATGNQLSELKYPQVLIGYEIEQALSADGDPDSGIGVPLHGAVVGWTVEDDLLITGADLVVGVLGDPAFDQEGVTFTGFVHFTFVGYGSPIDDQPDGEGED